MKRLLWLSGIVDRFNALLGRSVGWAILASILVSSVNAVVRKVFNASANGWLELQWHLFGAAILIASAYTLLRNEHIRIDIVSVRLPPRLRNAIELLGHAVFLLPFAALGIHESLPWVMTSLRQGERSANFGGLVLWPIKAAIFLGFVLLLLQALSEIIKRVAVLTGEIADPLAAKASHDAGGSAE